MYRIRIESCENADEGYTFDHETLAECITTCITEFSDMAGWFAVNATSEMATLLDTIVEAMRKHDAGEPPIAREWDFSSPDDAYYVVFYADSEDDDGTPCQDIWDNGRPSRDANLPSGVVGDSIEWSDETGHNRRDVAPTPQITQVYRDIKNGECTLSAIFDDGTETKLWSYYIDELSFSDTELVGLTSDEAHLLRQQRDTAYLRS